MVGDLPHTQKVDAEREQNHHAAKGEVELLRERSDASYNAYRLRSEAGLTR
jgi:hypothetical protein